MNVDIKDLSYPEKYDAYVLTVKRGLQVIAHFDFEGLENCNDMKSPISSKGGLNAFVHSRSTATRKANDLLGVAHPIVLDEGSPFESGTASCSLGGAEQRWINILCSDGNPLLKNSVEFVVSMDVNKFGGSWLFCASKNQRLNPYLKESYIGVHAYDDGKLIVERYSNGREGAIGPEGMFGKGWNKYALIVRQNSTALYMNEKLVDLSPTTNAKRFSLPILFGADGGYVSFGKGNWTSEHGYYGEFFDGLIDNIRIYAKFDDNKLFKENL